jgi:hypothetical protein
MILGDKPLIFEVILSHEDIPKEDTGRRAITPREGLNQSKTSCLVFT